METVIVDGATLATVVVYVLIVALFVRVVLDVVSGFIVVEENSIV